MEETSTNGQSNETQGEILIRIAQKLGKLLHNEHGIGFIEIERDNHTELMPLRSRSFKQLLSRNFYALELKPIGATPLSSALLTLEGLARYDCKQKKMHVRNATHEKDIWIDRTDDDWTLFKVTQNGWTIENKSPVKFKRSPEALPLPTPKKGGEIFNLADLLNLNSDSNEFILVVGRLIQACNPNGPYPILSVNGEQGSAKSSFSRMMKAIVDPNNVELRSLPKNEHDLAIACHQNWCLAYDNLSGLHPDMSDALCRVATGGWLGTRTLYADEEETIFYHQRPLILNGIANIISRHDLLDRAIIIELDKIESEKRITEKALVHKLNEITPKLIYTLLNCLSAALQNVDVTPAGKTRMSDFTQWVTAAEEVLPWPVGTFEKVYTDSRKEIIRQAVESNDFCSAVIGMVNSYSDKTWTGSSKALLEALNESVDESTKKQPVWPKSTKSMQKKLKVFNGFLGDYGVKISFPSREPGEFSTEYTIINIG